MNGAIATRSAASRKGWTSRKARAVAMKRFMLDGTPIEAAPERGTERGDYSPAELIERIRADQAAAAQGGR